MFESKSEKELYALGTLSIILLMGYAVMIFFY